jgi:hypothetical protein
MATSSDELRRRYRSLSDSELIELHKAGELTEEASSELDKLLSERGIDGTKIEKITSDQLNQQRQEYLSSSPKPIPKVWIGFVIAGLALAVESTDSPAVYEREFRASTLFLIGGDVYWLFCLYRFHAILKHLSFGTYPISPANAVGFHFIPFYNVYWVFKWPTELVRFLKQNPNGWAIPGWLLGLLFLLSPFVGGVFNSGATFLILIFCLLSYIASEIRRQVGIWNKNS